MSFLISILAIASMQAPGSIEPAHASNPVLRAAVDPGHRLSGVPTSLPSPTLNDGMSAAEEKAALASKIGSASRLEAILEDSASAPIEVRLSDVKSADDVILRIVEVHFAVHADEKAIDAEEVERKSGEKGAVEAGNMRFESREIPRKSLESRGITPATGPDGKPAERFVHLDARLLGRIAVEATDRVYATRSGRSVVVASELDRRFDDDPGSPNRWAKVDGTKVGTPSPYPGGFGYLKASRLAMRPGVVWVEAHLAFAEPKGWFGGEPVLRSKLGLAIQDQVRRLRRELSERKSRPTGNP